MRGRRGRVGRRGGELLDLSEGKEAGSRSKKKETYLL